MSSPDANDVLFGGGIPTAKFVSPGDTFVGPITNLEAIQQRKFDKDRKPTNELDYWDDGTPKLVAVATIKTDHRDPSDPSDDGARKLYIGSRDMQAKVRNAVKQAGQRRLDVGGVLSVTFTGEEKQESGLYAKIYEVSYTAPSAAAANAAIGVGQAPAQRQYMDISAVQPPAQQAQVPGLAQMLGGGQEAPAAGGAPSLENLPPEARALVERMMANQQSS